MAILNLRSYSRNKPSKDAKKIFIFCEGAKREYDYFDFFKEKDSRIDVYVHKLNHKDDNSPKGLLDIAQKVIKNEKTDFNNKVDEVWIVLDTDPDKLNSREESIAKIIKACNDNEDSWSVVESNPCFEVWLYYHVYDKTESFEDNHISANWKSKVDKEIAGGFNPDKHPVYIKDAMTNAEKHFKSNSDGRPTVGSTQVFKLAQSLWDMLGDKITKLRGKL